jgi:serine/threonine-protein kinase RsbW
MKHNISISCSKENLAKIRQFVQQTLDMYQVSDVESHKLVLAVDEVCANLIIHANNCNPGHQLELIIDIIPKKSVVFEIKDKGIGFDISNYQEPEIEEIVNQRRRGGLGLILVRRIMDNIEFTNEKNHNICRLIKNLK